MVRILKVNREHPGINALEEAKAVLLKGGLVILPTETVYGIACDPNIPGAIKKLADAKGRDPNKPLTRLAAGSELVKKASINWNRGLDALTAYYWPGPLTIVLKIFRGWTGFRVPDHAVAIGLAKCCGRMLALSSANLGGAPDMKTAQEAAGVVEADLALDSGLSAEQAIPSTVIKMDGEKIECLREGRVPFFEIEAVFYGKLRQ